MNPKLKFEGLFKFSAALKLNANVMVGNENCFSLLKLNLIVLPLTGIVCVFTVTCFKFLALNNKKIKKNRSNACECGVSGIE